jgi:hypothetical protein
MCPTPSTHLALMCMASHATSKKKKMERGRCLVHVLVHAAHGHESNRMQPNPPPLSSPSLSYASPSALSSTLASSIVSLSWEPAGRRLPPPFCLLVHALAGRWTPPQRSPLPPWKPPEPSLAPHAPCTPCGYHARRHGHEHIDHLTTPCWCMWTAVAGKGEHLTLGSMHSSAPSSPSARHRPHHFADIPSSGWQMDATSPSRDLLVAPRHWRRSKNFPHGSKMKLHRPLAKSLVDAPSFSRAERGAPCTCSPH